MSAGKALPCLACGKELDQEYKPIDNYDGNFNNHPMDGLSFSAHGHYGSAFFDPGTDMLRLEISICDDCMRTHRDRIVIVQVEPMKKVTRVQNPDKWLS